MSPSPVHRYSPSRSRSSERSESRTPSTDPEELLVTAIKERLRTIAQEDLAHRQLFISSGSQHDNILCRAVSNVLSTDLALQTYAQIVDGLPVRRAASDHRPSYIRHDHPIIRHEEICAVALIRARQFRDEFDIHSLTFHPKVPPDRAELHQLLHQTPPKARQTLFIYPAFDSAELYPEDIHDVVGYWAENRILGGVPTFNREEERLYPNNPPNVYFNSSHQNETSRLYRLHDSQQKVLVDFLISGPSLPERDNKNDQGSSSTKHQLSDLQQCPLPLSSDKTNRVRIDVYKAISIELVYRDVWERMPPTKAEKRLLGRRPMSGLDYPENEEVLEAVLNAYGDQLPRSASSNDEVRSLSNTKTQGSFLTIISGDMDQFRREFWDPVYKGDHGVQWEPSTGLKAEQDMATKEAGSECSKPNHTPGVADSLVEPPRKRQRRDSSHATDTLGKENDAEW